MFSSCFLLTRMRAMNRETLGIAVLLLAGLTACGGGGDSGTPPSTAPAPVFPLQAAFNAFAPKATSVNFTISGTCSGSETVTTSAPTSATFEGVVGQSKTTTVTGIYTNCNPPNTSFASTTVAYYDSNFVGLGTTTSTSYGKYLVAPTPLPALVKIGDTGALASETFYTDSTKTTVVGRNDVSYVIEADGSSNNSAIANLITKSFNQSNQLMVTSQQRYRIAADGSLTIVFFDVQYATTSTNHQVFTPN
jgi:hypothetical protein